MIPKIPFGKTGHMSTRTIFGAAALSAMSQERADKVFETLLEFGINHIDTAASYGDAELRIAPWMKEHRDAFFLATKTGNRSAKGARKSIENSLKRMEVDQIDLIQFHNLTEEPGWENAMRSGGALEAAVEARDQGLVRFIGVTGHGLMAPGMHIKSLERFDFDSVLFPYNYMLMQNPDYVNDVARLLKICAERGVAVQTIKSIARRRWLGDDLTKHFSWYEPVKDLEALKMVVHFVFSQPGIFLNTSSDANLLPSILKFASEYDESANRADIESALVSHASSLEMTPLFAPGALETI